MNVTGNDNNKTEPIVKSKTWVSLIKFKTFPRNKVLDSVYTCRMQSIHTCDTLIWAAHNYVNGLETPYPLYAYTEDLLGNLPLKNLDFIQIILF